jgi:hypothetical protein
MDETSPSTPLDDNECVSHMELKDMMWAMTDAFSKYQTTTTDTFQRIHTSVDGLAAWLDVVEAHFRHHAPLPIVFVAGGLAHNDTEDEFDDDEVDAQQRRRLLHHRQGMGGNGRCRPHAPKQDNDPYAKIKFSIPPFYGSYDVETYLDWEMMVEQKFSSHLVPERHRVRQATSDFKDFSIIWWNELVNARNAPQNWTALKEEMCARFLPPSYRRDLRKKLQRFDQGDMSVQEYYQELQKGMLRCGVVEDQEDQIVRFYGGLRREIQGIVDYKEYHSIQHLFQLAMLAKKRTAGSPTAMAEQHLHAMAASDASQSGALLERTCGHTSLHRCCTQHRTFNIKGIRQQQVPDTSWCCSKGYGAQHFHWSHL